MNERERIITVLKGEKPDRIPWYADLSYLYESMSVRNILEERYKGDRGYLKLHIELGAGICFYAPFVWSIEFAGGVTYREVQEKGIKTCAYITPNGTIKAVLKYLPESYSWAYIEHFVKDIDDLKTMLYIFENTQYTKKFDEFNRIDRLWGGYGIPAVLAPVSVAPLQKLLARWAGVEATINIYMNDKEEFEEIILRMESTEDKVFDIICASDGMYVEFAENLSSEITGKNFFERYNMPCYKKRIKQLHDAGKYVGIHIDGTLKSCLPLLEECGFDVAEAVTPHPVGDVKLEDLRKTAGDNIVIWGGLPGTMFTEQFSDNEFNTYLNKVLKTFSQGSRFVLGVADQIPPDGLISRIKKVRESLDTQDHVI